MKSHAPIGWLYSLANFGTSLTSFAVSTYVGFFYIALMGLPPRWVGWGLFAFSWWNALNDPLAGWLSDRTRSRWGRRIPYVATLALPLALTFAAVWAPPATARPTWLFAYLMLAVTLHDLVYTVVALNITALFPEMFADLVRRARVNSWRQIAGLVGMLVGVAGAPVVAARLGWPGMGMLFGMAAAASLWLALAGAREQPAYARAEARPGLPLALRQSLRHRAFLIYLAIGFLIRLALTTLNSTMPFYASYVLGAGTTGASRLLGVALGAALLAMRPWGSLLARWGARRTALAAELAVAASVLPFLLLDSWPLALAAAALAGLSLAGLLVTPDVLLAEVIDADHVYTGQRHEGIYFGLGNFVNRLPNVLQAAGIGEMLTLAGFSAGLTTQPSAVTLGLRLLIGGVPGLALGLAALLTWIYPLHGARLAQIKAQVAVLRAAAEGLEGGN